MPNWRRNKTPQVSITRPVYSMASTDGESAEITMYGDIYEQQPMDWWTGKPVEGQFILLSEFLEDLKQISNCKDITIRMNSYGGDAIVAITIHNRLRELAQNGAKLTCIVDGVAMSGGSLIMCACDTVQANPASLIMIHKCWASLWGGYNADELRDLAKTYDAYDKAQISIYKRKTGLSDTVLSHMMGATTYMTGAEAVEKKFADELIEDAEPLGLAASADGRFIFVRGRQCHFAPGMFAPDTIPTVEPEEAEPPTSDVDSTPLEQPQSENFEGGHEIMANTLAELRVENPQLAQSIEDEIRASERERIAGIDRIASLYPDEAVNAAKYGDARCDAATFALRQAEAQAATGRGVLNQLDSDSRESGANDIPPVPAPSDPLPPQNEITPEQIRAQAKADMLAALGQDEKKED